MRVVSCLLSEHNLWLVALAALVCVSGSWITFSLYSRACARSGLQLHGWAFLTSVAAGSSIWCTHFIATLAYEVSAPVSFDPFLTMVSLFVAITGCCLGFGLSTLFGKSIGPALGGALVGLSVACMHYTGMAAYHVAGYVQWDYAYVAASALIATALAALAVREAAVAPREQSFHIAVGLFVVAIVGLHFTGMAAVQVTPADIAGTSNEQAFQAMAVAVAGVALMIIGTGLASYLIDEQVSLEAVSRLRHMALNDALTGLPNRAHFSDYLNRELECSKNNDWRLAVICIDLDRFKELNDFRGHAAGDQALKIIGGRLGALLRPGEFIARIGGDEFSAAKRFTALEDVHDFLARIDQALHAPFTLEEAKVAVGGSIGASLFPDDGDDAARLILNADLAMYRAKSELDRSVRFYEKGMDDASRERCVIVSGISHAIENGELELHYQVQQSVQTGAVCGYEALLRWHHPNLGMISPAHFIPIAEETGAIIEIGEWVMRTACREAASWPAPHRIAVNVSALQLRHGDLAALIHSVLIETGLSPSRLEIELTETAIIQDKLRTLHTLRRIRALGVSVAIDDFGIGFSTLETLKTFPFDKIKLDRSFTHELEANKQTKAIVRAILALGKSLDIPVLAEGVETNGQMAILRAVGCDEVQGYLLGRPQRLPTPISADREPVMATG